MTSPWVDGASPRAGTPSVQSSSTSGSQPRMSEADRARSQAMAKQFAQQVELSMLQSMAAMGAGGSTDDSSGDGESSGTDDMGLGAIGQLDMAVTLLEASRGATGKNAALVQAQVAQLMGGGSGDLASLGQSLLGAAGADGVAPAQAVSPAAAATPAAASGDATGNAQIVAQVAREHGVDPVAAVAMMLVESGGRNTAVGDGGTSFGLFQLHEGGMLTAAGLTKEQAFDPRTNASVALRSYAHEWSKGHERRTAGQIAAASQRPADPVGYAAKVDATMDRARALLGSATTFRG